MRWSAVFALGCVLVVLAGCTRPLAAEAEPERPSVHAPPTVYGAAALWLNGTAHVSVLPPQVASLASPDEPHNCFLVRDTADEKTSFLSGITLLLDWKAASTATAVLNVTVKGPKDVPTQWSVEGPSPLVLEAHTDDVLPIRTPFTVEVVAAGGKVPVPEQPLDFSLALGVLESDLGGLAWDPCDPVPPPV